jgi:hypothetical protein
MPNTTLAALGPALPQALLECIETYRRGRTRRTKYVHHRRELYLALKWVRGLRAKAEVTGHVLGYLPWPMSADILDGKWIHRERANHLYAAYRELYGV